MNHMDIKWYFYNHTQTNILLYFLICMLYRKVSCVTTLKTMFHKEYIYCQEGVISNVNLSLRKALFLFLLGSFA